MSLVCYSDFPQEPPVPCTVIAFGVWSQGKYSIGLRSSLYTPLDPPIVQSTCYVVPGAPGGRCVVVHQLHVACTSTRSVCVMVCWRATIVLHVPVGHKAPCTCTGIRPHNNCAKYTVTWPRSHAAWERGQVEYYSLCIKDMSCFVHNTCTLVRVSSYSSRTV